MRPSNPPHSPTAPTVGLGDVAAPFDAHADVNDAKALGAEQQQRLLHLGAQRLGLHHVQGRA